MDDRARLYVADQAHASVARAARVLGFRPDQVRVLPTDADQRLQPDDCRRGDPVRRGRRAGAPLAGGGRRRRDQDGGDRPARRCSRAVCRRHGVWLHVDAAYGGFAALTERGRRALAGLELADSVTLDPHKWLYQPIECGSLLVREGHLLREAFPIEQDYLSDAAGHEGEVDFGDLGLQLSRASGR